ncbi:hypothetical protein ACWC24_03385 [Streptomyces sp. NPDC001443]
MAPAAPGAPKSPHTSSHASSRTSSHGGSAHHSASASPSASASSSGSASASASASASVADPERAGSRAGEGRQRPGGRDDTAVRIEGDEDPLSPDGTDEDPDEADVSAVPDASTAGRSTEAPQEAGLTPATPPGDPAHQTVARSAGAPEPVLRILPLGSGLMLMGLGFGLAFVALRLRRG